MLRAEPPVMRLGPKAHLKQDSVARQLEQMVRPLPSCWKERLAKLRKVRQQLSTRLDRDLTLLLWDKDTLLTQIEQIVPLRNHLIQTGDWCKDSALTV